jgi:hypothetical protein
LKPGWIFRRFHVGRNSERVVGGAKLPKHAAAVLRWRKERVVFMKVF